MAYIGQSIKNGTFSVLDTSGNTYNSSNVTFNLGTQVGAAAQLLVSKNGVIQKPGTDYTLATGGTQITFTTAPASGDNIFIVEISGAVGGTITPSDNSVGVDQLNLSDGSSGQFLKTDGSGTISFATVTSVGGATGVDFNDNVKARFGTGNDLEIYHDGSNSIIKDGGTGNINILADDFKVMNSAGDENIIFGAEDGTVRLFHNNVTRFETTSTGVEVTGALLPAADDTHDLGSSSKQWRDIYTGDINLNNTKTRDNEVDGTRGSWTIQEGENDLYLLNRLNGKKYKFNLTEVK